MSERTIHIFARQDVTITRDLDGRSPSGDVINNALNGNAFSWEKPSNLSLTFSGSKVAVTFDDADGLLTDDPFSGSNVIDQRLTRPVTINGVTYAPSPETVRWKPNPPVNVENEYEVTLFDGHGTAYRMVGVSITTGYSTTVVGVMFDGPEPPPGTTLHYIQGVSSYGGTGQSVTIPDAVPCFLTGTAIETPGGPRAVQDLAVGGQILTLDGGAQIIRWIGRSAVCGLGALAPVRIGADVLGNRRDLFLSPNHRILVRSSEAELCFGHSEVLIPAKSMVDGCSVRPVPMPRADYLHLMLDGHDLVFSEGIATESLFPGIVTSGILGAGALADMRASVPGAGDLPQRLCRPGLSMIEARYLVRRDREGAGIRAVPFCRAPLLHAGVGLKRAA